MCIFFIVLYRAIKFRDFKLNAWGDTSYSESVIPYGEDDLGIIALNCNPLHNSDENLEATSVIFALTDSSVFLDTKTQVSKKLESETLSKVKSSTELLQPPLGRYYEKTRKTSEESSGYLNLNDTLTENTLTSSHAGLLSMDDLRDAELHSMVLESQLMNSASLLNHDGDFSSIQEDDLSPVSVSVRDISDGSPSLPFGCYPADNFKSRKLLHATNALFKHTSGGNCTTLDDKNGEQHSSDMSPESPTPGSLSSVTKACNDEGDSGLPISDSGCPLSENLNYLEEDPMTHCSFDTQNGPESDGAGFLTKPKSPRLLEDFGYPLKDSGSSLGLEEEMCCLEGDPRTAKTWCELASDPADDDDSGYPGTVPGKALDCGGDLVACPSSHCSNTPTPKHGLTDSLNDMGRFEGIMTGTNQLLSEVYK